ncbi:hypothetical protein [Pasteurella multocida]|uniref:hypothetical protein n=1 Tax=Pasteurella multocida TaxID=747 RepID=UPI0032AEDA47
MEVDGSCNPKTYQALIEAGADVLIVGTSGLFNNADNIIDAWNMMEKEISQY